MTYLTHGHASSKLEGIGFLILFPKITNLKKQKEKESDNKKMNDQYII